MPRRTFPPAAIAVNRPLAIGPVIVSVPHAGRIYPAEILAAARVSQQDLEWLEDGWCDLIAGQAVAAGATVVQALWARAVADCNRGEGQMAPSEVAPILRPQLSAPGRKERAGLGVVPTRLAHCGPLWRRSIDRADLHWRLESLHRPFHAALAEELAASRARFGYAILIDLHSMPAIPVGQSGYGAHIVVGDRFGDTAGDWLIDRVMESVAEIGVPASRNQPYAGGHIIRTHGQPDRDVHAVQIEIDRNLYLNSDSLPDTIRLGRLARWFAGLVKEMGDVRPGPGLSAEAAE